MLNKFIMKVGSIQFVWISFWMSIKWPRTFSIVKLALFAAFSKTFSSILGGIAAMSSVWCRKLYFKKNRTERNPEGSDMVILVDSQYHLFWNGTPRELVLHFCSMAWRAVLLQPEVILTCVTHLRTNKVQQIHRYQFSSICRPNTFMVKIVMN